MSGISRRNFLKTASALGLGATLSPIMKPFAQSGIDMNMWY